MSAHGNDERSGRTEDKPTRPWEGPDALLTCRSHSKVRITGDARQLTGTIQPHTQCPHLALQGAAGDSSSHQTRTPAEHLAACTQPRLQQRRRTRTAEAIAALVFVIIGQHDSLLNPANRVPLHASVRSALSARRTSYVDQARGSTALAAAPLSSARLRPRLEQAGPCPSVSIACVHILLCVRTPFAFITVLSEIDICRLDAPAIGFRVMQHHAMRLIGPPRDMDLPTI